MPETSSGRGRPRRPETDERIVAAAEALVHERGPAGLTFEAVAARSGVARTTIYRRYHDRRELLAAALAHVVQRPLPPPGLPVEDTLRMLADEMAELLDHTVGRGGAAALLTGTDPEYSAVVRGLVEERLRALGELVAPHVRQGHLSRQVDPDVLVGMLLGAYLGEVLRHGDPREGWLDGTVGLLTGSVTDGGRTTGP